MLKKEKKYSKIFAFIIMFFIINSFFNITNARPSDKLKGYAWSNGAGWISFNCTNTASCDKVEYGVTTDANGNLSGFAWSDNLGWLSFNLKDMQGLPGANQAKINLNTGKLSGTAFFVNGALDNDDNWSGLVNLTYDSKYPDDGAQLNLNTYEIESWAWGDTNVGAISFNCENDSSCGKSDYQVTYDPFYFHFTANRGLNPSNPVISGGNVQLSWETEGGQDCIADGGVGTNWTRVPNGNIKNPTQGNQIISNLTNTTMFSLTCTDTSNRSLTRKLNIIVAPPAPSVSLTASDTNIPVGGKVTLTWTATNVDRCEATGDWSGRKNNNGNSETLTPNKTRNNYTITCVNNSLYYRNSPVYDSIGVDVARLIIDLKAEKSFVAKGEKAKITYRTEYATSCTASGNLPGWEETSITRNAGDVEFISEKIPAGNQKYTATLTCQGSAGQSSEKTIQLNSRKNPTYNEI